MKSKTQERNRKLLEERRAAAANLRNAAAANLRNAAAQKDSEKPKERAKNDLDDKRVKEVQYLQELLDQILKQDADFYKEVKTELEKKVMHTLTDIAS